MKNSKNSHKEHMKTLREYCGPFLAQRGKMHYTKPDGTLLRRTEMGMPELVTDLQDMLNIAWCEGRTDLAMEQELAKEIAKDDLVKASPPPGEEPPCVDPPQEAYQFIGEDLIYSDPQGTHTVTPGPAMTWQGVVALRRTVELAHRHGYRRGWHAHREAVK